MSWRNPWVEGWKEIIAEYFSERPDEGKTQLNNRLDLTALKARRNILYDKHILLLDTKIDNLEKLISKGCKHPLDFVTVTHKEEDVDNEINYSREHIGDTFRAECKICKTTSSEYYNKNSGWKNPDLAKKQKKIDDDAEKDEKENDKKLKEEREKNEYKRLKAKFGKEKSL